MSHATAARVGLTVLALASGLVVLDRVMCHYLRLPLITVLPYVLLGFLPHRLQPSWYTQMVVEEHSDLPRGHITQSRALSSEAFLRAQEPFPSDHSLFRCISH
jgi:hypothetical protein